MRQKDNMDYFIEEIAVGIAAVIGVTLIVATIVTLLGGCAPTHLTPAEIATTRPAAHPFTNVETFIAHGQQTFEVFNVFAFIVALGGLGIAVWGLVEANTVLERVGLMVAAISGAIAAGTLVGIIALPFSPWIVLAMFLAGVGYGSYLLYEKYVVKKTVVATPAK